MFLCEEARLEEACVDHIPVELLAEIFSLCGVQRFLCMFVCKRWQNAYLQLLWPKDNKCDNGETVLLASRVTAVNLRKIAKSWQEEFVHSMSTEPFSLGQAKWMLSRLFKRDKRWGASVIGCRAARAGSLPVLHWLSKTPFFQLDSKLLADAASTGQLEMLVWLKVHKKVPWHTLPMREDEGCTVSAALNGKIDVLRWAKANGAPFTSGTFAAAAKGGHMRIMQYLYNMMKEDQSKKEEVSGVGLASAIPPMAEDSELHWTATTCQAAARSGHFHILKFARERGCSMEGVAPEAAAAGRMDILLYAKDCGEPLDTRVVDNAAARGDMEMLTMALCSKHGGFSDRTCSLAASNGHFQVVKYLVENRCPLNVYTCSATAAGGHLHILKYLRDHGCPWEVYTCNLAAREGHLDVLQWAYENGCPCVPHTATVAAREGHIDVLEWLWERGFLTSRDTVRTAVLKGRKSVVQWLLDHGCPWDKDKCKRVARTKNLDDLLELLEKYD